MMKQKMFYAVLCIAALFLIAPAKAPAVEMFTYFNDGQSLGFEPTNATKRYYPGYRMCNGARIPVQPAPGAHPWSWRVWGNR
jgi:hypothetical protein